MNKSFFEELCIEEAELVERLRVLREFKDKFFTPNIQSSTISVTPVIPENKPETKKVTHKKPVRRTKKGAVKKITVAQKVLNALEQLRVGKSKDVALKLIELYPSDYKNPEKATGDARYQLSDLKNLGKIEIHEIGQGSAGNSYRIKIEGLKELL